MVKSLQVSTIIPTFNRADLICRAVSSVLKESRTDDEVIVVDDGSTDNTEEVLRVFGEHIRYLRISHSGVSAARNYGIKNAKHDLIAFLDSDDEWIRGTLDIKRALMEVRPDVLFCCSDFAVKDSDNNIRHRCLKNWHKDPRGWDQILGPAIPLSSIVPTPASFEFVNIYIGDLYPIMMPAYGSHVCAQSLVVRREEAGEALRFEEDLSLFEVWECAAKLSRKGLAAFMDCETALQYSHSGPRLSDWDSLRYTTNRIKVLKRVWGSDPTFLKNSGELYRKTLVRQQLARFRELLVRGQNKQARAELSELDDVSWLYHLLARLPGPIVRGLLKLRRALRN